MDSSIVYKIIEMVGAFLAGGGLWAVIKAKVDKKKTPYEMFMELMQEQRKFQEQLKSDYANEKLDSAEKSAVIMKSQFCEHKFKDKNIVCPVDRANDERLEKRCERCGYNQDNK